MKRRKFSKLMATVVAATIHIPQIIFTNTSLNHTMADKIKLRPLVKGDQVALIAPGSPVKEEKFENALKNMEILGLKPVYSKNVLNKHGFLAGSDEERLNDIHDMFENPKIKAIWCLRGGYGCTRLLPKIDYDLIKKNHKIFIGYSDVTALLLAFHKKSGLTGFHGPVASSQIFTKYTFDTVKAMLFNEKASYKLEHMEQTDEKYLQEAYCITPGKASGRLTGGNLSLLVSLIGTAYAPSYKNKIVFIEEIGEKPYRIDRMLTQMMQATDLLKARAIVFGVFSDCEFKEGESSFTLKETLINAISPTKIPSCYGLAFGHVSDISTFPIDVEANVDTVALTIEIENPFD